MTHRVAAGQLRCERVLPGPVLDQLQSSPGSGEAAHHLRNGLQRQFVVDQPVLLPIEHHVPGVAVGVGSELVPGSTGWRPGRGAELLPSVLFDRVVIKELEPDRVRHSGLLVPPGSNEPPPQHGIVLAVGPGIDWWQPAGVEMPVRPGDHVVFPAAAGAWVEVDEERLLVCRVAELLGVLEEASVPAPSDSL